MKGSTKVANKIFRNFFLWIRSKEFLVFLFFLIVSGLFWGLLAIKEPAEMEMDVVIKLVDKPSKVIVPEFPDQVKVTVRDKGYNLIGYYFDKPNPINVRFGTHATTEGKIIVSNSEIIKLIKKQLKRSTDVLVVKPDKLEAYYNYGDGKKVKVVFDGELKVADKYFITKTKLTPESVTVYALNEQLAAIDSVKTKYLRITDISKNEIRKVPLVKMDGVNYKPEMVTFEVNADVRTEGTTEVPIALSNVPENIILHIYPKTVSVSYVTGASNLEAISAEDFDVEVDYKEIERGMKQDSISLKLCKYPALVKRPILSNDSVGYTVEKR